MTSSAYLVVFVAVVIGSITKGVTGSGLPTVAIPVMAGFIGIAALIFTRYLWAFELTGALLITAALGAMVLAHRERWERREPR